MTKKTYTTANERGSEVIFVSPNWANRAREGGRSSRPFPGSPSASDGTPRTTATPAERARARKFRELMADLSPEMDRAYRQIAAETETSIGSIPESEINKLVGPILAQYGYDADQLALERESSPSVKALQTKPPAVFDLDLTDPYNEVRRLQEALELILQAERLYPMAAYWFPIRGKSDTGAAVIAPLQTWESTVQVDERNKLVTNMKRVYDSLAAAARTETEFDECRIVHFQSCDQAKQNAIPKLRQSLLKRGLTERDSPLVIVEGGTVIAALPRDDGNHVISAKMAIEIEHNDTGSDEAQVLPDMSAIIAHLNCEHAFHAKHLS